MLFDHHFMYFIRALFLLALCLLLSACTTTPSSFPVTQSSFAEYREGTATWLAQHRHFQSENHADEIALNTPQEQRGTGVPRHGVLLIHGLGDSPFSFVDIGHALAEKNVLVRTVLLPGHGSKPEDLLHTRFAEWQTLVETQIALLKQEVDDVYIGGFSTGANLALLAALRDDEIAGVMLFSPAFKSDEALDWMLPLIAPWRDWFRPPDSARKQQTWVRYMNVPVNGFFLFYRSSTLVRNELIDKSFDRPAILVAVEHDSVVDVRST